jgi:CubicO group peptidase (beta-lactamase class C family)
MRLNRIGHAGSVIVVCGVLIAAGTLSQPLESHGSTAAAVPADLAAFVAKARLKFNVPSVAVAVVKDGRVVFEQSSGERRLGDHQRADIHTMFCIASNTKSFTATAIEMLADQGKLRLDDRVVDHLAWFRMSDPYVTRELRIRDLLAHRSGLGSHAGDLLFTPGTTYSTREVVEQLADLPLATGFRSGFAYENLMFAVATLIIEQASGQSYADFIQEQVFKPIGMSESRVDSSFLERGANYATAYVPQEDGRLMPIPALAWPNNRGAAGIYSSVHDMAKWVQVQLANGALPAGANGGNQRLISPQGQQRMWSMITPIDIDAPPVPQLSAAQPSFFGYAEGWYLSDYRGRRMVWHTGGFPGTVSIVTLVPELNLGIVVLTNQESESAFNAITLHILDAYLGVPNSDWIGAFSAYDKLVASETAAQSAKRDGERLPGAAPAHSLTTYRGNYRDRWYGDVDVQLEQGTLRMRFSKSPRLIGSLTPWRGDTFLVRWDDRTLNADALVDFAVGEDGAVGNVHMRRASAGTAHAYDFQDLDLLPVD